MTDGRATETDSWAVRELPPTEAEVRRFVEELWIPYHRELSETVGDYGLAEDVDVAAVEVEHRLAWLDDEDAAIWIAVDSEEPPGVERQGRSAKAATDAGGFVCLEVDEAPSVFDRPDRLLVRDLYVRPSHRGEGLGRGLLQRAAETATERDCSAIALDVDEANDAARAFYDAVGFETVRRELRIDPEQL